ncbi:hypothetical protein D3C83_71990 [compost metagenome]
MLVLAVAQDAHLFLPLELGVALLGLRLADAEMPRQARDVRLGHLDLRVAAAVGGAFRAVVGGLGHVQSKKMSAHVNPFPLRLRFML